MDADTRRSKIEVKVEETKWTMELWMDVGSISGPLGSLSASTGERVTCLPRRLRRRQGVRCRNLLTRIHAVETNPHRDRSL